MQINDISFVFFVMLRSIVDFRHWVHIPALHYMLFILNLPVMFLLVNLPSSVCLFSGSASNRQVWFAHSISPPKNFVYQIHHPATSAPSTHQRIWGASQILLPFHTSYSLSYWSVQMYCRQHQLAKDTNGQSSCCCFNQCPFVAVTNGRHFPIKNISNGFLRRWFRLV